MAAVVLLPWLSLEIASISNNVCESEKIGLIPALTFVIDTNQSNIWPEDIIYFIAGSLSFRFRSQWPAARYLHGKWGKIFGKLFIYFYPDSEILQLIPDVLDSPPRYPLEVSYKTIRTFPGMRMTADMTRFKPMLKWPAQPDSLYTVVMSNLDINSRRNR